MNADFIFSFSYRRVKPGGGGVSLLPSFLAANMFLKFTCRRFFMESLPHVFETM